MKSGPVIDATLRGIERAKIKYQELSGYYLHGAEYVATTYICEAVHKVDSVGWVTVEHNARNAIKEAGGSLQGWGKKTLPFQDRFDIAVWNSREEIRGLIEVKTSVWGYSYVKKDISKLCQAIKNRRAQIRWGLVAYFSSFSNHETTRKEAAKRSNW